VTARNPIYAAIGTQYSSPGNESAVAFYIDDIYITDLNNALMQLNDIDRVEVLKGSAGTLFGRNTTGGLISIHHAHAWKQARGAGAGGYANFDTASGSLYLAGRLTDRIGANLSVVDSHQGDGYGTTSPMVILPIKQIAIWRHAASGCSIFLTPRSSRSSATTQSTWATMVKRSARSPERLR